MNIIHYDRFQRFLFDDFAIRGEIVSLDKTLKSLFENHNYPKPIQLIMAELLTATVLLSATLKFEGEITIQLQSDSALKFAVVSGNERFQMRGTAKYDESINDSATFNELIKNGLLVITISPKNGEAFQGIVTVQQNSLSQAIEHYFVQSEQLPTKIILKTDLNQMLCAGLLLQILPQNHAKLDEFERICMISETISEQEIINLPKEEILFRLFHEDKVTLFDENFVEFKCHCSKKRCENALKILPKNELIELKNEQEIIKMTCDYCKKTYLFSKNDIEKLIQNKD